MNNQAHGHSNISWGTIIAGAAAVAGVALLAPTLFPQIGTWFTSLFQPAVAGAGPSAGAELLKALTGSTAQAALGATLVGGSLAYFMGGKKNAAAHHPHAEDTESFQTKLQMDRANNLMVLRAAYAGNPQAQAMLAQQTGRS